LPKLFEAAEMAMPKRSQLNRQNAEAADGKAKPVFRPKQDGGRPVWAYKYDNWGGQRRGAGGTILLHVEKGAGRAVGFLLSKYSITA
jgi:hypothetical protein